MYQLTATPGVVIDTDTNSSIPVDSYTWQAQAYRDWLAAGNTPMPVPPPTVADIVARFLPQLQAWIDGIAQQNGYDTALSCISYAGSSVTQWDADAKAMIAYRDALWTWAYQQQATLAAMTPDQLAALTVEQIIAQAPPASASGWAVHAAPGG